MSWLFWSGKRLISKFLTSKTGKQIITIHVLLNITRREGNQTMKFGQLIEYNTGKFFSKKSNTKCGREHNPKPLCKKLKFSISLNQNSEMLYNLFLLYTQVEICHKSRYWPNFIASSPLLLELLSNICIVIICLAVCDVIKFELNPSFLIKTFFYMTEKSR